MNRLSNSVRGTSRGSSRGVGLWYNMKGSLPNYGSSVKKSVNNTTDQRIAGRVGNSHKTGTPITQQYGNSDSTIRSLLK